MQVNQVEIGKLKASEYNPRQATEKECKDLKASITEFGMVDPIIVNSAPKRKNIIIGGHFRAKMCKELGLRKIPVVYVNIPQIKKEQELNLRLNKNLGQWDWDLLANFDEELLKNVGFESEDLDQIFGLDIDENYDVDKELSKILKNGKRRVKAGDLWQLGSHKLIIGDCTNRKVWETLMGKDRFDFMFTDPPYQIGVNIGGKKSGTAKYGKVKKKKGFGYLAHREYKGLIERGGVPEYNDWLSIAKTFENPRGANVMIFENWRNTVKLWGAIEKYWKIRNMIIWWLPNRNQGFSARHKFFSKYDIAPLAGEGTLNEEYEKELEDYLKSKGQKLLDTYGIMIYGQDGKSYWDKKKKTKWAKVNDHITFTAENLKGSGDAVIFGKKPIQILVPYIKVLCPREGILVEPFAGSGSALIGCKIMKRQCRAIEVVPIYGEVMLHRWEKFTGREAVRLNGKAKN